VESSPPASPRHHDVRQLLPTMRALLVAFAVLTAMAVIALFVLADDTDRVFAWTIQPPLTAAFLGAGYAAGFVLVVLSFRDPVWAHTRVPVLTILAFVVLTLIATLVHIDRFHFQQEFAGLPFVARAAAWFWLGVYVLVPVLMLVALAPQERAPGRDPEPAHPVPGLLRTALAVESAVLLVVGIALYSAPSTAAWLWPWPLTPLTARVTAAWLIAFGLATGLAAFVGDLRRLRTAAIAYTVFGVLVIGAQLRFFSAIDWNALPTIAFALTSVAVVVTGAVGWRLAPSPRRFRR
jgi:hypothetical protein